MALSSETVTLAGSGIVFNNTYDDFVTPQVRSAILAAENYLQAHFTNPVTLNIQFTYTPLADGSGAENSFFTYPVAYADLVGAMTSHATTADDRLAVAGLPLSDPSNGLGFRITSGLGQALGLLQPSTGGGPDVTVMINSGVPWNFGADLIGAVEHEITEGGFGRFQYLGLGANYFTSLDLFRFNLAGQHDFSGGADGQYVVFGVDGAHLTDFYFHNAVDNSGHNDGSDFGDWDFEEEDAFGHLSSNASISAVDLQVLDVLGWTPSGAPPGSGPDDFADSFADAAHPFGQLSVGTEFHGTLQAIRDRDWFQVTLNAGTDYVISLTGKDGGGGTLVDPNLHLRDAGGVSLAFNDDLNLDSWDSQLIFHATTSGTYYLDAESYFDEESGTYTVKVMAGAAQTTSGSDFLVGTLAGGTVMAGGGNDTITADTATNYLRGEDGDDSVVGGGGFDDINGNMGNDTINGGLGDDWVVGGKGDDQQFGYDGDDIVWGNLGNDTLDGGYGADQVRGGQGNDVVNGGPGNDFVSGDRGDDTVTGGSGADRFHDSQDAGIDRVTDFSYAQGDRVMLDPGTTFTASQVGADTVLDMGGGNQMILVGVTLASLPPDYVFFG